MERGCNPRQPKRNLIVGLVGVLSEGVTAFFTDWVLHDQHFGDFVDANASQKESAKNLIVDKLRPDGF